MLLEKNKCSQLYLLIQWVAWIDAIAYITTILIFQETIWTFAFDFFTSFHIDNNLGCCSIWSVKPNRSNCIKFQIAILSKYVSWHSAFSQMPSLISKGHRKACWKYISLLPIEISIDPNVYERIVQKRACLRTSYVADDFKFFAWKINEPIYTFLSELRSSVNITERLWIFSWKYITVFSIFFFTISIKEPRTNSNTHQTE